MILNILILAGLAAAQPHERPATPHAIVAALYAPYRGTGDTGSAIDAIRAYATKGLKRLIDADDACQKREQGICNIDADVLIAGQDGAPSHLAIHDDPATRDGQVVRATFRNGGPVRVTFVFVREDGAWKIDDVEDVNYGPHGRIAMQWRLKKTLQGQS